VPGWWSDGDGCETPAPLLTAPGEQEKDDSELSAKLVHLVPTPRTESPRVSRRPFCVSATYAAAS